MRGARPFINTLTLLFIITLSLLFLNIDISLAYDERHLDQIKTLNACVKCDLSKSDLRKLNAKEAILVQADISESNLASGDFRSANLVKANLKKSDLTAAKLNFANILYFKQLCQVVLKF